MKKDIRIRELRKTLKETFDARLRACANWDNYETVKSFLTTVSYELHSKIIEYDMKQKESDSYDLN